MIFPVWVSAWEIGCCQPEAVVGQPWEACLFLEPPKPWWRESAGEAPLIEDPQLGVVTLDVDVTRPAPRAGGYALARVDSVGIGVKGAQDVGALNVRGCMVSRWHGPNPRGVALEEVACEGDVRRVRLVPVLFEQRG